MRCRAARRAAGGRIGSSLYHVPGEPADRFWALSDRGPNIACSDAEDIMGVDPKEFCKGIKQGRVYPSRTTAVDLRGGARPRQGQLHGRAHHPVQAHRRHEVTGLPNPLTKASTETPLDGHGNRSRRSGGLDTEALVRLPDGSFWIGEENGPSLLHVAARRHGPSALRAQGSEGDFAAAGYPVEGTLPAILTRRQLNRGNEPWPWTGTASSGRSCKTPWPIPTPFAFKTAANARVFKIDPTTGRPVGGICLSRWSRWPISAGETKKPQARRKSANSPMSAARRFLIDDRTDKTTASSRSTSPAPRTSWAASWDDLATKPTLEQTDLAAAGVVPRRAKRLRPRDARTSAQLPGKIEGMTLVDGVLYLINDDDFGIEGAHTNMIAIEGLNLQPDSALRH